MGRGKNDGYGEWRMIQYIYDEIACSRAWPTKMPTFPNVCPICKSKTVTDLENFFNGPIYKCGGQYNSKPQIQTHTDKWWGKCPVVEEDARKERGRECDGCGEKRLEGTGFPVESFGWTCKACNHRHEPIKKV